MTVLSEFAEAVLDPQQPGPRGVTSSRGAYDPLRFAIYRNNHFVSLVGALEARFPVTRALVGAEFFQAMARVYAASHKPVSPVLLHYGDHFPQFIKTFPPAASVPYLADMARIEVAWSKAYHARDAAVLSSLRLDRLSAQEWRDLRFVSHPPAALVLSEFPVGSIWSAHQTPGRKTITACHAEAVLIVRPQVHVGVLVLPAQDARFARDLLLGDAVGMAADRSAQPGFDATAAVLGLLSLGAFSAAFVGAAEI